MGPLSRLLILTTLAVLAQVAQFFSLPRAAGDSMAATQYAQVQPQLFRAKGMHHCQSETDIGHQCSVFGTGYTNCDEAYRSLKAKDCCLTTRKKVDGKNRYGGTSIGFSIDSCTKF
jgi:hypothetical protein